MGKYFILSYREIPKPPPSPTPTSNPEYTPGKKLTDKQKRQIKRVSNIFTVHIKLKLSTSDSIWFVSEYFDLSFKIRKNRLFMIKSQIHEYIARVFKMSYYIFQIICRGKMSLILIYQFNSYFKDINLP